MMRYAIYEKARLVALFEHESDRDVALLALLLCNHEGAYVARTLKEGRA